MLSMGKSTISMAIFNSHVKLPESIYLLLYLLLYIYIIIYIYIVLYVQILMMDDHSPYLTWCNLTAQVWFCMFFPGRVICASEKMNILQYYYISIFSEIDGKIDGYFTIYRFAIWIFHIKSIYGPFLLS